MELDEVKERYKLLPLWVRLLACALPGIFFGVYFYMDQAGLLEARLDTAQKEEMVMRQKFEKAKRLTDYLPKQEAQLSMTEAQLKKAKEKLPDQFNVERILEKSASVAKEMHVELSLFDPQDEKSVGDLFKYKELPIKIEVKGKFVDVAMYMDRIAHFENIINFRELELKSDLQKDYDVLGKPQATTFQSSATGSSQSAIEVVVKQAADIRKHTVVKLSCRLVLFRSLAASEAAGLPPDAADAANKPKPPGTKT